METLAECRSMINKIDHEIVALLAKRMEVVRGVVKIKMKEGLNTYDPQRENQLIATLRQDAANHGMHPDFIQEVYHAILKYSKMVQNRERGGH